VPDLSSPSCGSPRIVQIRWSVPGETWRGPDASEFLDKPIRQSELHPLLCRLLPETPTAEIESAAPISDRPLENLRFLIVSDRPAFSRSFRALLQNLGGDADEVDSGQKTLQALDFFHYDGLFLDLAMTAENP